MNSKGETHWRKHILSSSKEFLERKFEDQFLVNGARFAKITENMVNFASWDEYKEHNSAD